MTTAETDLYFAARQVREADTPDSRQAEWSALCCTARQMDPKALLTNPDFQGAARLMERRGHRIQFDLVEIFLPEPTAATAAMKEHA